jgi:hypothetical protein
MASVSALLLLLLPLMPPPTSFSLLPPLPASPPASRCRTNARTL